MKYTLIFSIIFGILHSCTIRKNIFNSQTDYLIYNNSKYAPIQIIKNKEIIGTASKNSFTIKNNSKNKILIFSTVLENESMFYSKRNITVKNNILLIDSFYNNYMDDASNSGIKKFNFIEIQPNNKLVINYNIDDFKINFKQTKKIQLQYYFLEKKSDSSNNLLEVPKDGLKVKTVLSRIGTK
ncbi:hypothetical protein SAMN05421857_1907 [Chryseobacterium formosense]|nr:hypothetical protein [Chryseobacterium formosense]SFT59151.1 hypothetical protein SAMN05421857_1907 [Chryseobacterium formosense]